MDIGLDGFGKVEIDHQPETGHINAARRDISGDKHLKLAALELAQHFQADRLPHVAMQHIGIQPVFAKPVSQIFGAKPCPRKDQHLPSIK